MQVVFNPRRKKITSFLAFLLAAAWFGAAGPARADGPQGWWLDQTGRAGIEIAPCGAALCGWIEWLRVPLDKAGKPKTDIHNPNTALRSRPMCRLQILGGFTPNGNGGWRGGWIYDPSSGNTYKSVMHVSADGQLHVRGYIGITLIGRSAVWTKPAAALTPCT